MPGTVGTIEGFLFSGGEPLESVDLLLMPGEIAASTGEGGFFAFTALRQPEQYSIEIDADGFARAVVPVMLSGERLPSPLRIFLHTTPKAPPPSNLPPPQPADSLVLLADVVSGQFGSGNSMIFRVLAQHAGSEALRNLIVRDSVDAVFGPIEQIKVNPAFPQASVEIRGDGKVVSVFLGDFPPSPELIELFRFTVASPVEVGAYCTVVEASAVGPNGERRAQDIICVTESLGG